MHARAAVIPVAPNAVLAAATTPHCNADRCAAAADDTAARSSNGPTSSRAARGRVAPNPDRLQAQP